MPSIDPAKAKVRMAYSRTGTFYSLAFDASEGRLFAGSDDGCIYAFNLASTKNEPAGRWGRHDNYVSALALLEHGVLISGSFDRRLIWWDADRGEVTRVCESAHNGWVRQLAAAPGGLSFASVGDDMVVRVWEASSGRLVRSLEGHARETPQGHVTALYAVTYSPDGRFLASGDRTGSVCVWEVETGKLLQRFEVPVLYTYDPKQRKRSMGGIRTLAFSPEGQRLAVGGIGQVGNVDGLAGPAHVEVWDWRTPKQQLAIGVEGHKGIVNHVVWGPEGWLIGAGGGGDGGFLAFWPPDAKAPVGKRVKVDGHVHRIALNGDGLELYAAGHLKLQVVTFA